jgi:hypothetical protein
MKKMHWKSLAAGFLSLAIAGSARADTVASDRAAALVVFPFILGAPDSGIDTTVQLSNTSTEPVAVHCFYVNAIGQCSVTGDPCLETPDCPEAFDLCIPQWVETDFDVYLTARQPIAWQAGHGLLTDDLPLDGVTQAGPNGQSNAGTRVPPFGEDGVGEGELKCYAVNGDRTPSDRNVLIGDSTLSIRPAMSQPLDVAKYSAVGFRAIEGANNGDDELILGGPDAEYDGCPNVLILDHFFDSATDPVSGEGIVSSVILTPCTENFLDQAPTPIAVQYLVFNEFEQRFSTSHPVDCFFLSRLSHIDTSSTTRSIFSVFVGGTLAGQTRIHGVNGGLIGIGATLSGNSLAEFNLHTQGEREAPDIITVVR